MAVNCSSGFRSRILGPASFDAIFQNGAIEVRSGPQPDSADAPATGALLGRITNTGGAWTSGSPTNGLRFTRAGIYVTNDPSQTWVLSGLANGEAGWFRLVANATDPGDASATHPRIDGAIGPLDVAGDYQIQLPTTTLSASTAIMIPSWWFVLPPL